MKNIPVLLVFISFSALTLGCDKCKDNCGSDVSISAVLPNNNPVGYEVLIKTEGFSNAAQVVFGTEKAISRPGGKAGEIIAKVPAGLSGNVEISVEEGDCIERSGDFIVSGSLPSNVQPSLLQIIVPVPASSFPPDGITNQWRNATTKDSADDKSYGIFLDGPNNGGIYQLEGANEYDKNNNPLFSGNPVTGTIDTNNNVIYLEIDRTSNGGSVERFDGLFIEVPAFLFTKAKYTILLVSRETGRQLLIYYPKG